MSHGSGQPYSAPSNIPSTPFGPGSVLGPGIKTRAGHREKPTSNLEAVTTGGRAGPGSTCKEAESDQRQEPARTGEWWTERWEGHSGPRGLPPRGLRSQGGFVMGENGSVCAAGWDQGTEGVSRKV